MASEKPVALIHLTMNTGHVVRLPLAKREAVRAFRKIAKDGGEIGKLLPKMPGWSVDVAKGAESGAEAFSLCWEGIPMAECVLCWMEEGQEQAWRGIDELYRAMCPGMELRQMPADVPWLAVVLLPTMVMHKKPDEWRGMGEIERIVGWAILERETGGKEEPPRRVLQVRNNGREIAETNFWELAGAEETLGFSFNAGALRVLFPEGMEADARETATGKVAVLSIGMDVRYGRRRAHLMFDDGSDSPYSLESDLAAFDRVPVEETEKVGGRECIVYTAGLVQAARMPLVIRFTQCPDYTPGEEG